MLSSYLSLALCTLLVTASPISNGDIDTSAWTVFKGSSVNPNMELFNLHNYGTTSQLGIQSTEHPGTWVGDNLTPVCDAFCINPATDPALLASRCATSYCTTTLNPNAVYVAKDGATGLKGAALTGCPTTCPLDIVA